MPFNSSVYRLVLSDLSQNVCSLIPTGFVLINRREKENQRGEKEKSKVCAKHCGHRLMMDKPFPIIHPAVY